MNQYETRRVLDSKPWSNRRPTVEPRSVYDSHAQDLLFLEMNRSIYESHGMDILETNDPLTIAMQLISEMIS